MNIFEQFTVGLIQDTTHGTYSYLVNAAPMLRKTDFIKLCLRYGNAEMPIDIPGKIYDKLMDLYEMDVQARRSS